MPNSSDPQSDIDFDEEDAIESTAAADAQPAVSSMPRPSRPVVAASPSHVVATPVPAAPLAAVATPIAVMPAAAEASVAPAVAKPETVPAPAIVPDLDEPSPSLERLAAAIANVAAKSHAPVSSAPTLVAATEGSAQPIVGSEKPPIEPTPIAHPVEQTTAPAGVPPEPTVAAPVQTAIQAAVSTPAPAATEGSAKPPVTAPSAPAATPSSTPQPPAVPATEANAKPSATHVATRPQSVAPSTLPPAQVRLSDAISASIYQSTHAPASKPLPPRPVAAPMPTEPAAQAPAHRRPEASADAEPARNDDQAS
jgi:hypothetical protein